MAIVIYRRECGSEVAFLCEDDWELPVQIDALRQWVAENSTRIGRGSFVADVGFKFRSRAGGGGAYLDPATMRLMADLDMELFLSKYQ